MISWYFHLAYFLSFFKSLCFFSFLVWRRLAELVLAELRSPNWWNKAEMMRLIQLMSWVDWYCNARFSRIGVWIMLRFTVNVLISGIEIGFLLILIGWLPFFFFFFFFFVFWCMLNFFPKGKHISLRPLLTLSLVSKAYTQINYLVALHVSIWKKWTASVSVSSDLFSSVKLFKMVKVWCFSCLLVPSHVKYLY